MRYKKQCFENFILSVYNIIYSSVLNCFPKHKSKRTYSIFLLIVIALHSLCTSVHITAQSAEDRMCEKSRSPVDIEVFWPDHHHSPDPPNCWTSWLEGFKIALLAKTNIAYDALLDDPTEHVALPRFTNASAGETDDAREIRLETNRTAQQEYKTRWDQAWAGDHNGTTRRLADQKARAMLFMSMGTEAKKRLTQRTNEFRSTTRLWLLSMRNSQKCLCKPLE